MKIEEMLKFKKFYFFLYAIFLVSSSIIIFQYTQGFYKNFHLGEYYLNKKLYEDSVKYLEKAFYLKSDNVKCAKLLIKSALKSNKWEESIFPLIFLHKKFPTDIETHELLADAFYKTSRLKEAEDEYRNLLKINPKSNSIRRKLVEILSSRKKYKEAIILLSELSAEYPHNLKYQELLGDIYSWDKNYTEAVKIYKQLIKNNFHAQAITLKIADSLRFAGKDKLAIKYYKKHEEYN